MDNINWQIIWSLIRFVLYTIGLLKLFAKLEVNRKWALVPFVRFYKLAEAVGHKDEALAASLCTVANTLLSAVVSNLLEPGYSPDLVTLVLVLISLSLAVLELVYHVKIYTGVCDVFGVKHGLWLFMWVFFEEITAFIWGVNPRFIPVNLNREKAAPLSGKTERGASEGLVIDIKSRTAGWLFNRKTLLKDIHLTVKPGRMVLLLGGSGAGKTTFVNAVTGYEKASARIMLNGKDVYRNFREMQHEIGIVPQKDTVRYKDTVFHTINDNARLRLPDSYSKKDVRNKVGAVMDGFGLGSIGSNIVGKQSGGQIKRISISMEYVADPFLFVLDEPDSGLDGMLARSLMKKLHEISREGRIIIVITHTPDRVIDMFDDVIVLAKDANRTGRLAFYGTVDEARTFFGKDTMEGIISVINRKDEGGEGRADELIQRFEEERNGAQ